jgi:hypothetical protein
MEATIDQGKIPNIHSGQNLQADAEPSQISSTTAPSEGSGGSSAGGSSGTGSMGSSSPGNGPASAALKSAFGVEGPGGPASAAIGSMPSASEGAAGADFSSGSGLLGTIFGA